MQYNADFYIERLLNYYNLGTISELATVLNTKQTSISSWRKRDSVNAIKKKCREVGIYNDIFTENNSQVISNNSGQIAQNVDGNQSFHNEKAEDSIDTATYNLFKEAYEKAIKNDDLKSLRVHLMDY
ncbi:MAG: hypothetical protein COA39_000140 [Sulfurimonas sp.]|nr:hypothetical protein [Sulfurimonas sp.]